MSPKIQKVPVSVTWPLRQAVLRPHQTIGQQRLPSDDLATSGAFAAFADDGAVVATAVVMLEEPPFGAADLGCDVTPGWRLRGMATQQEWRGSGLGTALLDRVVGHVVERGGALLWCTARLAAVDFYQRADFRAWGAPWDEPDRGPHVVMWRPVAGVPGGRRPR